MATQTTLALELEAAPAAPAAPSSPPQAPPRRRGDPREVEVLRTATWWIVSEPAGWNPICHGLTGQVTEVRFRGRRCYVRENLLGRGRGGSGRRWAWHLGQHKHGLRDVLEVLAPVGLQEALLEAVAAEEGDRRPVQGPSRDFTWAWAELAMEQGSEEALRARWEAWTGLGGGR